METSLPNIASSIFNFTLYTVHYPFECDFENAEIEVLDDYQTNIQGEKNHVDGERFLHRPANPLLCHDVQEVLYLRARVKCWCKANLAIREVVFGSMMDE